MKTNKFTSNFIKGSGRLRLSNMELFRIIAMFLVLVVHADYYTLNAPTATELATTPVSAVTRIFIECLSIGCVNMFILISDR